MRPDALLQDLNPSQVQAVTQTEGPTLVLAGAGSGKTRTVVHRVAYLLAQGVLPTEIFACTFTNKAAGEMRSRIERMIKGAAAELWISTFHSACVRILRLHAAPAGLKPGFVIYDENDQLEALREIGASLLSRVGAPSPRQLQAILDRAKCRLWGPAELDRNTDGEYIGGLPRQLVIEAYRRYEQQLSANNALDFGSLLTKVVELFQRHPEALESAQRRTVFIHVDEYQDTNHVQYVLANLLASRHRNLCAVGDPDQSIYAFRGADISNILSFQKDYPDAQVIRLEENYRSPGHVLQVANSLIAHNRGRLEKTLLSTKGPGPRVGLHRARNAKEEADFVAHQIERLFGRGIPLGDIAVLYRTNAQSRLLEESLRRSRLSATIVGGTGFYQRREIKDILCYLKLLVNPADSVSLLRVVNVPRRSIGATSLAKLLEWARAHETTAWEAITHAEEILTGRALGAVVAFRELLTGLLVQKEQEGATSCVRRVIEQSGYAHMLEQEGTFEARSRLENLEELTSAVAEWEAGSLGNIAEFLDQAALLSSADEPSPEGSVLLMTLHNAKGLEFPYVFIVGLEEGLLPHRNATDTGNPGALEEERRLLYVGITRAMERLVLTYAAERSLYGDAQETTPSRFLGEVDESALEHLTAYGEVIRSLESPPVAEKTLGQWKGGEKVVHDLWGEGLVVGVRGSGEHTTLTVLFYQDKVPRQLMLKYAPLRRI
ncbi:MAG: UvrD-helicase domain-containing protein [Deinococcus sp.]|nr:UvrD-helicase domain-containing protein [Deinococcus sp.]